MDALLFSMLVLKGLVDGSGKVWRCFPQQLYLVEATYGVTKQVCSVVYGAYSYGYSITHSTYKKFVGQRQQINNAMVVME